MHKVELIIIPVVRKHWIPFLISTILIMFEIVGDIAFNLLCYDRPSIDNGQLWRLLSGHLMHLSWSHLGINLAGLMFLWLLIRDCVTPKEFWLTIFFSALIISLCLLDFNQEVLQYAGFSGVLHSIWVVGALLGIGAKHKEAYLLLTILAFKLTWEQLLGPLSTLIKISGGFIVVDAHLYGAIAGLMMTIMLRYKALNQIIPKIFKNTANNLFSD